jgi:hypothetical protein
MFDNMVICDTYIQWRLTKLTNCDRNFFQTEEFNSTTKNLLC